MKSKLKNLDVAKKKGSGYIKKELKKELNADFEEPTSFFYDSEFDYEGEEGKTPILFVGEIPSLWKKYIKQNKASKTLAAGRCMFQDGVLSLEVKTGKGGKRQVLKEVFKMLLKPFAKVQFVDSVEGALEDSNKEEIETTDDEDVNTEVATDDNLLVEAQEYMKEAIQKEDVLNGILNDLGPKVKDLSKIVVTDNLIAEALNAMIIVQDLRTDEFIFDLKQWLDAAPNNDGALAEEVNKLTAKLISLTSIDKGMDALALKLEKLKKVQNPSESEVPPVDTKASAMLKNAMSRIAVSKKDFFKKAVDMFKTISKAGEV